VRGALAALVALASLVACAAPGEMHLTVLDTLTIGREEPEGYSLGFDLDGRDSDDGDADACFVPDLVHAADGTRGIDNAFGALYPALELVGGNAIEGLVQDAINSGELLLMVQIEGMDDPRDDDSVTLRISQGIGAPEVGTHGLIESGQTFDPDPDVASAVVEGAAIVDGVLDASGFDLDVPLQVFDTFVDLTILDGHIHLEFTDDGGAIGYVGGGLTVAQVTELANGVGEELTDTIIAVMDVWADLEPNDRGECQRLSMTMEFSAVTAFYFE